MTELDVFKLMFPLQYLNNVVIHKTNKHLMKAMTLDEMFHFLGCIFKMATVQGFDRWDFWSLSMLSTFERASWQLNEYMSHNWFEEIVQALTFTNV